MAINSVREELDVSAGAGVIYTVPANKTLVVSYIVFSSTNASSETIGTIQVDAGITIFAGASGNIAVGKGMIFRAGEQITVSVTGGPATKGVMLFGELVDQV